MGAGLELVGPPDSFRSAQSGLGIRLFSPAGSALRNGQRLPSMGKAFMTTTERGVRHYDLPIGGQQVDTLERYEIRSPATRELVATVAKGDVALTDRAVAAARAAHEAGVWRNTPPAERGAVLGRIAATLAERIDELAVVQVQENGTTIRQAMTFHLGSTIAALQYFAEQARTYAFDRPGPTLQAPTLAASFVRREPIGVCAAIVPWNFPLLLAMWKIGPALAAGNTMVIKPDEQTPLTLLEFARIAQECGLPAGVLNVVTGDGPVVGARLAEHPDVRKIAFTGSTAVGREIMRRAAGNVKRITLELGGKGPNIVLDDADLQLAVDGTLFAFLLNQGQACESGTRLFVPRPRHDEFVDRMIERARTLVVGDPLDPATDLGPVISAEAHERILGYLRSGREEGATVALGGGVPSGPGFENGYWIEPTIFTGVRPDMTIAREEIFGPVLAVLAYDTVDEAVALANDSEYGLSAGVWSSDTARALDVAGRIEAGTVWINDWHMVGPANPFGGYKQSGVGRELGPHALDEYTEEKFIHLDLSGRIERRAYPLLLSTPPARR
jgi:betaine-aldehyde dehydrogenase